MNAIVPRYGIPGRSVRTVLCHSKGSSGGIDSLRTLTTFDEVLDLKRELMGTLRSVHCDNRRLGEVWLYGQSCRRKGRRKAF